MKTKITCPHQGPLGPLLVCGPVCWPGPALDLHTYKIYILNCDSKGFIPSNVLFQIIHQHTIKHNKRTSSAEHELQL